MKYLSQLEGWIKEHKLRIILAFFCMCLECALLFGTGVLREAQTHYLTGEGSWALEMTGETSVIRQEFSPQYQKLQMISFFIDKDHIFHEEEKLTVRIIDKNNNVLFEKELFFSEIEEGAITDIEVGLQLMPRQVYCVEIAADSYYDNEYPSIVVCGKEYVLDENINLITDAGIRTGEQLVMRYQYADALTSSHRRNALLLCVLTMLGILIEVPRTEILRKATGISILVVAPYILGQRLELLEYNNSLYLPFAMKWNIGIIYGLEIVVLLLTHSLAFSAIITNIGVTLLYSANYFMILYRGTPLRMNDFSAIGTAAKVVGQYDLAPNSHLAMVWAILALIIVWSLQTISRGTAKKAFSKNKKFFIGSYIVTTVMAVGILWMGGHVFLYTDFLDVIGFADKEYRGIGQDVVYLFDGYLVATLIDVKSSRVEVPNGYSVEYVGDLLSEEREKTEQKRQIPDEEKPHIFLIMNESLADLNILDNAKLSEDNLSFIHSLHENTVHGFANVSVFGGATANSEFEVFTGCTMAFLGDNVYPYQQTIRGQKNSMISQMNENGYTTISIHPESDANWNRKNIYRYFGFDQSLWKDDFPNAEVIHSGVSDAETFHKIIELYENRQKGEKLFVFDLTMQNHGGYGVGDIEFTVTDLNKDEPQLDEYLSLVKISDEAFAELVSYFEKQDEKVIICMYGDHHPWVSNLLMDTDGVDGIFAQEQNMKKYKTPLVIWANYDIEERDNVDISLNYLGGFLMQIAGLSSSPYFEYLSELRAEYPIITVNGYVAAGGNYYTWSGEKTEFSDYRMLQYNYLSHDAITWGY